MASSNKTTNDKKRPAEDTGSASMARRTNARIRVTLPRDASTGKRGIDHVRVPLPWDGHTDYEESPFDQDFDYEVEVEVPLWQDVLDRAPPPPPPQERPVRMSTGGVRPRPRPDLTKVKTKPTTECEEDEELHSPQSRTPINSMWGDEEEGTPLNPICISDSEGEENDAPEPLVT